LSVLKNLTVPIGIREFLRGFVRAERRRAGARKREKE